MERGCEWRGSVTTLEEHVAKCMFFLVPCPKQCKDASNAVQLFIKKDLCEHLKKDCPHRDYECQNKCGVKGTFKSISEVHDRVCKKKVFVCYNAGCDKKMERQQISKHVRTECPHTVIECKYKRVGCAAELKRKDMAAHECNESLHLGMALDTVSSLQETVGSLQRAVSSLQRSVSSLQETVLQQSFAMPEYRKRRETSKRFTSPSFYSSIGYHIWRFWWMQMDLVKSGARMCLCSRAY